MIHKMKLSTLKRKARLITTVPDDVGVCGYRLYRLQYAEVPTPEYWIVWGNNRTPYRLRPGTEDQYVPGRQELAAQ